MTGLSGKAGGNPWAEHNPEAAQRDKDRFAANRQANLDRRTALAVAAYEAETGEQVTL